MVSARRLPSPGGEPRRWLGGVHDTGFKGLLGQLNINDARTRAFDSSIDMAFNGGIIEVRLFDDVVETFDMGNPEELQRLAAYLNYHSRNRCYRVRKGTGERYGQEVPV